MDGGCQENPTNLQDGVSKGGNLSHVMHEGVHNDLSRDLRAHATNTHNNVKAIHHAQETQKGPLVQDTDKSGSKQVASTVEQIQQKKGAVGIEGTQDLNIIEEEFGEKTPNNKSRGKMGKKKRQAIKRRQQAETGLQGNDAGSQQKNSKVNTGQNTQDEGDEYDIMQSEDEFDQDTQSLNENEEEEEETSRQLIKAFGSTMFQQEIQEVSNQQGLSPRVLCWNARSINSQGSLERLQTLKKLHNITLIAILEPFADNVQINTYKSQLNMDQVHYNNNGKIWIFWNTDVTCTTLEAEDQHITLVNTSHGVIKGLRKQGSGKGLIEPWLMTNGWRKEFGDIFSAVRSFEEQVRAAEEEIITNNSEANRTKLHYVNANYIKYLKLESSILKQKTQLQWFKEGDANSKYFHAIMRGRMRRLFIHKISDDSGIWVKGDKGIGQATSKYFQKIFFGKKDRIADHILQCLPRQVADQQNQSLQEMVSMEEVRNVVFAMNPNSASRPDGFVSKFYQSCWEIVKADLLLAIQSYFSGHIMPKFMSHACLVLLPKTEHPNNFSEFRPISLTNFTNKIISKILCLRLAPILPNLIYENQSGFVKGRSISEIIMLAQEITHYIKKPQEGDNVVIKLDMAKAYDRVSWAFTCIAMRTMGFGEVFIDLVWTIMSNNWYSVIVNGSRHGFFHSTRGLKQGDPLSPALLILGAEVLSRMLNLLHQDQNYKGFHMQIRGPQINHLCFADDVIIFTAATTGSLQLIMKTLSTYEVVSDQSINKEKSHFMIPTNTPMEIIDMSIPIHTMASISHPKTTLNYIKRVTADFFWGWDKEKKKYHWASWETLSYPYEKGGIGVRKLEDTCKALQIKQWWNFRTKNFLWSQFLRAKYCQRSNPIAKKWDVGQSLVWKYMMKNKTIIEPHITWKVHSGNSLFWWDDWLGEGQLAQHDDTINNLNNITVSYFLQNGHWYETVLRQEAPLHLITNILSYKFHYQPGMLDEAVWKPTGSGDFSCATAWQICRQKKDSNNINSDIWHKYVPFKISFLVWRALRYKLPTNEKITTFGSSPVNCSCCR
ncbi:hypothetical protein MTR67_026219 [Solanum verrucosum]|uniref:Reverse transcriptase domain-containing protein n=1 Tax=Solanum verrucosum TaxID=315347 RepID=A0AAF0QYI8_SOLVR|nr:hypothetical protein MTR67_026219 [Solanum verrucosum]